MKLKPEYEAIRLFVSKQWDIGNANSFDAIDVIRIAVEQCQSIADRCQTIADRPVKMLTVSEIDAVWIQMTEGGKRFLVDFGYRQFADAIEAAHIAKQSASEVVPFDFATWQQGGWVALNDVGMKQYHLYSNIYCPSMMREST